MPGEGSPVPIDFEVKISTDELRKLQREVKATSMVVTKLNADEAKAYRAKLAAEKEYGRGINVLKRNLIDLGSKGEKVNKIPIPGFKLLGNAIEGVGAAATLAANPLGLAVLGVAALVGVAAGAVAGTALLGIGITALVAKTDDLYQSTAPFRKQEGFLLSPEDVDNVNNANAALDAIIPVVSQIAVTFGAEFAPYVERGATLLVAVGLASLDAARSLSSSADVFANMSKYILSVALNPMGTALAVVIEGWINWADLIGITVPNSVREASKSFKDLQFSAGERVWNQMGDAVAGVELELGDYMGRAEDVITVQRRLNAEVKKWVEVDTSDVADNMDAINDTLVKDVEIAKRIRDMDIARMQPLQAINAKYQDQIEQAEALLYQGYSQEQVEGLILALKQAQTLEVEKQKKSDQEASARKVLEIEQKRLDTLSSINDAYGQLTGAALDLIGLRGAELQADLQGIQNKREQLLAEGNLTEAKKEMLRDEAKEVRTQLQKAWKWHQALSISETIANGLVAGIKAVATLGPIAGPIAAIAIGATTMASVAKIKAEKPSFAVGGIAQERGYARRGSTGQIAAILEENEGILNQSATRAIGGPKAVNRLNSGGSLGGGVIRNEIYFNNAMMGVMMTDTSKSGGKFNQHLNRVTGNVPGVAKVYT